MGSAGRANSFCMYSGLGDICGGQYSLQTFLFVFIHQLNYSHNVIIAFQYSFIVVPLVWYGAFAAVLEMLLSIHIVAFAAFAQSIERTIAEQTVEFILWNIGVTGKILALAILKKAEIPGFLHG